MSKNGFLPADAPLEILHDGYYRPWETIIYNLPALVENGIRESISQLPLLSTDRLLSEAEWRRAYVILAFMTNAYVWGGNEPEEVLPPQVTIPFLCVAAHLELPPILTYAAANLWNFSSIGDDYSSVEGLRTLVSFTSTETESWFILISVAIEAEAAGIITTLMEALECVKVRNYNVIINALEKLKGCIQAIGVLLDRMHEKCDPMVFYHRVRPFLAGFKGMECAGLPRGVFYDEGGGNGKWRQFRGGSNGQSSLIQFFDTILGVDHNGHGSAGTKSYHEEMREYMPGGHRRFLMHVSRLGSIYELAMKTPKTPEQQRLRETFTAAREALGNFRGKHIQIVTRYIILPSKQPWKGARSDTRQNLVSQSAGGGDEELTGTGGTTLLPFLKQARYETTMGGNLGQQ
ncbi:hypothetical protein K4F52_008537 [Lecanicillium sp. MT-2017a]|nr:hypothetical protein K4F52_008537 [Lecanicillium sp. MT-2017a]